MKALVVCKQPKEQMQKEIKEIIENAFSKVTYSWKNTLKKQELSDIDIIISIGGDGTALSASHFNESKPLLAVNSSPENSVGALTTASIKNLKEKLEQIKSGNFKTENLERIEATINNNQIDSLALNEIFIANEKAYLISRYKIKFKDEEEIQRASGIIFSTGTGSTAWFKSAGGTPFSPQTKFIKMIAREPYKGKADQTIKMQNLEIAENEEIEITPLVKSILAVDSIKEYPINPEDKIKIKISKHPLKRII